MGKPVLYAVVDYPIDSKDEVASVFFCISFSAEMAICKSYEEAKNAAAEFLAEGSIEVGIIPIKLDVDNVECAYSKTVIETVKLEK